MSASEADRPVVQHKSIGAGQHVGERLIIDWTDDLVAYVRHLREVDGFGARKISKAIGQGVSACSIDSILNRLDIKAPERPEKEKTYQRQRQIELEARRAALPVHDDRRAVYMGEPLPAFHPIAWDCIKSMDWDEFHLLMELPGHE